MLRSGIEYNEAMTSSDPCSQYSPGPAILERKARAYLRSANGDDASRRSGLKAGGRDAFRRIRRITVIWAIVSGTVSGAIIGGTEMFLRLQVLDNPDSFEWREHLPVWAGFYAFVGLVTVVEIAFLYWMALRGVVKIGTTLDVSFAGDSDSDLLTSGLARSALEISNPKGKIYGIDPYAFMPRWRLLALTILYKVKVGTTSFFIRVISRRVFARAVLRGYIPLLAIPLYAIWNAIIISRVMNEAWIRTLGPFMVGQIQERLSTATLHEQGREIILEGVAEMVRRGSDAHPNYVLLLSRLMSQWGITEERLQLDWTGQRKALTELSAAEKSTLLAVLTMTGALTGKLRKQQHAFLRDVHRDCNAEYRPDRVETVRRELIKGRPVPSAC